MSHIGWVLVGYGCHWVTPGCESNALCKVCRDVQSPQKTGSPVQSLAALLKEPYCVLN